MPMTLDENVSPYLWPSMLPLSSPSSRLPTSLHSLHLSLIMPPEYQLHYFDWTNFFNATDTNNQVYYYFFKQNAYLVFDSSDPPPPDYHTSSTADSPIHEGYRAIGDNVPKSFAKALLDPEWVDPARSELHTIVKENNDIVLIDPELARQHIRDGAEVLYMHPVYEKKRRQGCQKGSSISSRLSTSTTGISTKSAHS
jgi:hypothetical protein